MQLHPVHMNFAKAHEYQCYRFIHEQPVMEGLHNLAILLISLYSAETNSSSSQENLTNGIAIVTIINFNIASP